MTRPEADLSRLREVAEAFLVQCGACDAGLPMGCACHDADPRPVIANLLDEIEALRATVARVRVAVELVTQDVRAQRGDHIAGLVEDSFAAHFARAALTDPSGEGK